MIVVRHTFQTKWGKSQEVVESSRQMIELMKEVFGPDIRARILTDLSGPFHTVVQEIELESLAVWERDRGKLFSNPAFQKFQARTQEQPFISGSAEFYTLEAAY
jgi:hypothetical protein